MGILSLQVSQNMLHVDIFNFLKVNYLDFLKKPAVVTVSVLENPLSLEVESLHTYSINLDDCEHFPQNNCAA